MRRQPHERIILTTMFSCFLLGRWASPATAQDYSQGFTQNGNPPVQPAITPVTGGDSGGPTMVQPVTFQFLPAESGALASHIAMGMQFSSFDLFTSGGSRTTALVFSVEAQAALSDGIELGVNVPFMERGYFSGLPAPLDDFHFGNVQANVKIKLFGDSHGPIAISLYSNATLPTTSLKGVNREYVFLQPGVAVSAMVLSMLTLGVNSGTWMFIGRGPNMVLYNLDFFAAIRLIPQLVVQMAWQAAIPIRPSGGDVAFSISPAVQFYPLERFHLDLGARFAVTDAGRIVSGGRAALIAGFGIDFN